MSEKQYIDYEDFKKVEIKLGEVLEAEEIPGSDKLYKLKVSFGEEERQILSGIKKFVSTDDLVGKKFPFVTNLPTRKMMGFESEGMILAVSDDENLSLLNVDPVIKNGTQIG